MGLLLKSGLDGDVLQAAGLAVLAVSMVLLVGGWRSKALGLVTPALLLGSCIGNTAYFGVPLALAFLPPEALTITLGETMSLSRAASLAYGDPSRAGELAAKNRIGDPLFIAAGTVLAI